MMDIRSIALALGGDVVGANTVNCPGPGHSPRDRSLSVTLDPAAPGGVIVHSFAGDDWRDCRDHVTGRLGIREDGRRRPLCVPTVVRVSAPSDLGVSLWSEAVTAKATIVETYLASRGVSLPERPEDVLRFHPSCPFGKGQRQPCMIALYRDIQTNEPKAIHRTALTADGRKIDRKALGPKSGCAIKLTDDAEISEGLTISEGIETGLAGMALNFRPTWALSDAGELARFPVLSGIECLTILVDNDASGTGQASALHCSRRWTSQGREVFRVVPTSTGMDMADVVCGRAA